MLHQMVMSRYRKNKIGIRKKFQFKNDENRKGNCHTKEKISCGSFFLQKMENRKGSARKKVKCNMQLTGKSAKRCGCIDKRKGEKILGGESIEKQS